jgi:hypothetical protein
VTIRLSTGLRNAGLDAGLETAFDGGIGRINFYTGAQPASANDAASGTLLATVTLASDAFGEPSAGAIAMNDVATTTALASGTVGYYRIYRTGDTAPGSAAGATDRRLDGSVTATGGGGDVTFDVVAWVSGGTVDLTALTFTQPAG